MLLTGEKSPLHSLPHGTRAAELRSADSRGGCPTSVAVIPHPFVVNANVSSVFCSTSCALALPVAGLALELRFTDITWRAPAMRSQAWER